MFGALVLVDLPGLASHMFDFSKAHEGTAFAREHPQEISTSLSPADNVAGTEVMVDPGAGFGRVRDVWIKIQRHQRDQDAVVPLISGCGPSPWDQIRGGLQGRTGFQHVEQTRYSSVKDLSLDDAAAVISDESWGSMGMHLDSRDVPGNLAHR
ncbi:MAG: hypothetical protein Q9198_007022 [Flavoplaca austrocitrina]